jgi:ATP-dependent RNA helicase DDX52/ROK1
LFELNFLEQTDEILAACKRGGEGGGGGGGEEEEVRKGMFSATMPSTVEELAKGVMAGAGAGMVRAIVGHKCVPPAFPSSLPPQKSGRQSILGFNL